MIRTTCFLKVGQVTTDAGGRRPFVFTARVAGGAVQGRMHSSQRKSGDLEVVEGGIEPGVNGVTLLALSRESGSYVIGRSGLLECLLVT
jgi:hypothetical protein